MIKINGLPVKELTTEREKNRKAGKKGAAVAL